MALHLNRFNTRVLSVAKRQLIRSRGFQPTELDRSSPPPHRVAKRHLNLTKQVPLIPNDIVLRQNSPELVFKLDLPVMLLLSADVLNNISRHGLADCENRIAILPGKILQIGKCGVNPARRSTFDYV